MADTAITEYIEIISDHYRAHLAQANIVNIKIWYIYRVSLSYLVSVKTKKAVEIEVLILFIFFRILIHHARQTYQSAFTVDEKRFIFGRCSLVESVELEL